MSPEALLLTIDMSDEEFEKRLGWMKEFRKSRNKMQMQALLFRLEVERVKIEMQQLGSRLRYKAVNED